MFRVSYVPGILFVSLRFSNPGRDILKWKDIVICQRLCIVFPYILYDMNIYMYMCITMYSKFLSEANALWRTSCTNFILMQWVEVFWQHLPAVLPAIFVTVNMSSQIVDEEGNILPNNVEGNVGLRVKPHRPVGLFTKYVVKSPNQLN